MADAHPLVKIFPGESTRNALPARADETNQVLVNVPLQFRSITSISL
jgi:hypothetical protein